jgi:hypothetical protein
MLLGMKDYLGIWVIYGCILNGLSQRSDMGICYYRILVGDNYRESVNGCPTLLIDSEPAMVVVRNSAGRLVMYLHYKSRDMYGIYAFNRSRAGIECFK